MHVSFVWSGVLSFQAALTNASQERSVDEPISDECRGELIERIATVVKQKTGGRVESLEVVWDAGKMILRGRSRSYHDKQLAQEAALKVADSSAHLENQIEVCKH
jgi:hypothetical protein